MEENKRKQVIQELGRSSANDNIDIYFRRPVDIQKDKSDHRISTSADNTQNIYVTSPDSGPHSITSTFRRSPSRRDKIEIDSDNIETPPVTRKSMVKNESASEKASDVMDSARLSLDNDGEPLGNGQFDRFSSARKTRRYKRPTLSNAGSDDQSPAPVTPEPAEKGTTKVYIEPKSPPVVLEQINMTASSEDKDSRLKRWQERLKSLDQHNSPTPTNTTSRSSSRKSIASAAVNPEEVKDAVHYLQRQTSKSSNKVINMEMNDEGFEESQSLVSDTPSQGKDNNSGTETNEGACGAGSVPVKRMNSSESAITTTSNESKAKPTPKGRSLTPSRHLTTRTQSLRSASATRSSAGTACPRPNLPIRQTSLRKNDSDSMLANQAKRIPVQKSNSRNSLLSSRSSLNSAVSTSTVKKAPTTQTATKSTALDSSKKIGTSSLASRLTPNAAGARTLAGGTTATSSSNKPASTPSSSSLSAMRSSNLTSASAAAQQLRDQLKRPTSTGADSVNNRLNLSATGNYPLKGSHSGGLSSTNSINSFTSKIPANPTNSTMNSLSSTSRPSSAGLQRKGSAGSNFMRPTASSVTKASLGATASAASKPSRFR